MWFFIIIIICIVLTSYTIHDIYYLRVAGRNPKTHPKTHGDPATVKEWPPLTCVIPAANEECAIEAKIKNLRSTYPAEKLTIIVALNNSTDSTREICTRLGVKTVLSAPGKQPALEAGRVAAETEYVFVTDADVTLEEDTVKKLVMELNGAPDDVVAVSGYCEYTYKGESRIGKKMNEHEHKQAYLCELQGERSSSAIIQGPCYVYKKSSLPAYPVGAMEDELSLAIAIAREGKRAMAHAGARGFQYADTDIPRLLRMLTRHVGRQIHSCLWNIGIIKNSRTKGYGSFIFPFYIFIPRCLPLVTLFVLSIPFLTSISVPAFFLGCIVLYIAMLILNPFAAIQVAAIHLGWVYFILYRNTASVWENPNRAGIEQTKDSE